MYSMLDLGESNDTQLEEKTVTVGNQTRKVVSPTGNFLELERKVTA